MLFAINYSTQAAELLDAGAIQVDRYKVTEWPEMIAAASRQRPVYVHFPLMAGRGDIERTGWQKIADTLAVTGTPYVNMHLAPRASDFADMPLETTSPARTRELLHAMQRDINRLAARFGREKVILENANWDPNYEIPRPVIEPDSIARIVNDTGCLLLLDLAHARMAAAYLAQSVRDYISRLPLNRLAELHIAGTLYDASEARLVDHFPMTEDDWSLAEWALDCIRRGDWQRPWLVALEYGGTGPSFAWRSRADVIAADAPRLYDLVTRA
jgi:uncharacterized protein (UPF0276 family)